MTNYCIIDEQGNLKGFSFFKEAALEYAEKNNCSVWKKIKNRNEK